MDSSTGIIFGKCYVTWASPILESGEDRPGFSWVVFAVLNLLGRPTGLKLKEMILPLLPLVLGLQVRVTFSPYPLAIGSFNKVTFKKRLS